MLLGVLSANLKSNMDRFIGVQYSSSSCKALDLKSNMDRFIVSVRSLLSLSLQDLKSNMDRFIELYPYFSASDL